MATVEPHSAVTRVGTALTVCRPETEACLLDVPEEGKFSLEGNELLCKSTTSYTEHS
jgi:hypothetical protein